MLQICLYEFLSYVTIQNCEIPVNEFYFLLIWINALLLILSYSQ